MLTLTVSLPIGAPTGSVVLVGDGPGVGSEKYVGVGAGPPVVPMLTPIAALACEMYFTLRFARCESAPRAGILIVISAVVVPFLLAFGVVLFGCVDG
jgi:hypothetical protein